MRGKVGYNAGRCDTTRYDTLDFYKGVASRNGTAYSLFLRGVLRVSPNFRAPTLPLSYSVVHDTTIQFTAFNWLDITSFILRASHLTKRIVSDRS